MIQTNATLNLPFDAMVKEILNDFSPRMNKKLREDVLHFPPVNIEKLPTHYEVAMQVPGYKKSEIEVKLEEKILTISSVQQKEESQEEAKMVRREFSKRSFKRSFTLDDTIDAAGIQAKYEDGILHLLLPVKAPQAPEVQTIQIQ